MAKRLTRSRKNRVISGVAGGMAEYFGLDPTLVRVLWVVFTILPLGTGVIPYLILWAVLPEGDATPAVPALQIAEERYARGEITADELHTIRRDLGGR